MRNRSTIAGAVFATLLVAGCGSKSPTQPTTPSSPTPGPTTSGGPVVRLQVKVDDDTPRDALASMSEVVVDASGSTGSGAPAMTALSVGGNKVARVDVEPSANQR